MGDPRRLRKKYEVPRTLWDKDRINEESALVLEFGLKNVKELWGSKEELRKIRRQARALLGLGEKGQKEFESLARRVENIGYGKAKAVEDLLGLETRSVLERRLQSLVFRKGLARSMKQARQLITHGFISVGGKKVSRPGYLVPVDLEGTLSYYKPIDISVGEEKEKERKLKIVVEKVKGAPKLDTETAEIEGEAEPTPDIAEEIVKGEEVEGAEEEGETKAS